MTGTPDDQLDQIYERFAATLERTQWLPRESLDAYRDHLLGKLASFAFAHSPFYRERLKPLFHGTDVPDLGRWSEVPILTRSEVEREIDRINPSHVPDELGPVLSVKTSGTTGERFSFRNTYLARIGEGCMMHRLYRWNGFDLSAPLASIRSYGSSERGFPEGITEPRWAYPGPSAPHYTIDVRTPVADLIDWLVRRRPTYLLTFPSIAHEMALHPDAAQVAKLVLKAIVGISEIVLPKVRSIVRERFGCEITQFYGCSEIGSIAVQSPLDETYLVCEETALVELLDDDGNPVGPGETGRVVLTGFYNYATPFIRYAIGDFATWAVAACPSGRALRRLQRVEGRTRNVLIAADGRRIWPAMILTPMLFECLSGMQFQIRQPRLDDIDLLVAASNRATEPDRDRLTEYFSTLLGRPISLTVTRVERVPRSIAGKFEGVISSVSP